MLLALVSIFQITVWLSEKLWFESLGYGAHFGRLFAWRAGSFVAGALLFGGWLGFHAHLAWRNATQRSVPLSFFQSDDVARLIPLEDKLHLDRYRRRATLVILAALAWGAGLGFSARYDLFLRAFSVQSTGLRDAASGFDLAFFLFALPFYAWLSRFLLVSLVAALGVAVAIYGYEEAIGPRVDFPPSGAGGPRVSRAAAQHLAVLWAMLLLWQGLHCILSVPATFVSRGGAASRVFDPLDISWGWTPAGLFALSAPLIALLSGLSLSRGLRPRVIVAGLTWMASASLLPALLPLIVARDAGNPDWTGALSRHISSTRRAWGLENVSPRSLAAAANAPFRAANRVPATGIQAPSVPTRAASESISNGNTSASSDTSASGEAGANGSGANGLSAPLPLWPPGAAQTAFNRRLEASGSLARVSRVWLERSAQGLVYCALAVPPKPAASAPWQARHEREARGAWLQMEAGGVAPGGGPIFAPEAAVPASLGLANGSNSARRGRAGGAAFGSEVSGGSGTGDGDEWILSRGEGAPNEAGALRGVDLSDNGVKMLLAMRFLDGGLVRDTHPNSRVIWHRGAAERCRELAPFLDWQESDARPVRVESGGFGAPESLQWIVPGVVWTDDYPDSATPGASGAAPTGANYGRHVAAGVVDAQTGATTLYLLDQNEPYAALYARVFPDLFALPTALPTEIRAHLRPSPTLLVAQTLVWARYHDADPLSWVAHRADYRPLFLSPMRDESGLRPLASAASGDWNLMAYARPEGQVRSGSAAPLAAILGADERFFGAGGSGMRWIEWRAAAPLPLPDILVEPVLVTPGAPGFSPASPLGSVAPRLDAEGNARGLLVTSGAVTSPASAAPSSGQLRLQAQIRISGAPPETARVPPPKPFAAPQTPLQAAQAAWREVRAARLRGDWEGVARAEKRLDAALGVEAGTR